MWPGMWQAYHSVYHQFFFFLVYLLKKYLELHHFHWRLQIRVRVVTGPPWPEKKIIIYKI